MTLPVTIDALHYALRRGFICFDDNPLNIDRLRDCDDAAIRQISAELLHMHQLSKGARPNWPPEQVTKLVAMWRSLKAET
jgi:hypothetical protein